MPAQLNLRVAILGGAALVMFSIIFFRLWYLQVLSSGQYVKEAQNNQVRVVTVQAPRGEVTDRTGQDAGEEPDGARASDPHPGAAERPEGPQARAEAPRRGRRHALRKIQRDIHIQEKQIPGSPVTLKRDVPYDLVYYLRENQEKFRGVSVDRVYVRDYPHGTLAAHILGYVREVSPQQLKDPQFEGVKQADQVGQAGVEYTYDSALRGINGQTRAQVDAAGRPTGGVLERRPPQPGDNLRLTIDDKVQEAGQTALTSFGLPGAFVAMNVNNGQILGMGSTPSYDPSFFTHPILSPARYKALTSQTTDSPLTDRAIQGGYPTGSTMKPITSIAALESGTITPSTGIFDGGSFKEGTLTLQNAGGFSCGCTLTLPEALKISDDVFFYNVGNRLNTSNTKNGPMQRWMKALGLGRTTGIDIPGELPGLVPTPAWRNNLYKQHQTDRPWSAGDSVNLAVGQGDLQADPLQMSTAYAALANGGNLVRPHVGLEVDDASGRVVQEINPAPQRHVSMKPSYANLILGALHDAAQSPGGTSYSVFGGYSIPVAGKTGTAQRVGQQDQSWYVVLAPYPNPQVVVAVTIEQGGFGVQAAAPAAQKILTAFFQAHGRKVKSGTIAPGAVPTGVSNY